MALCGIPGSKAYDEDIGLRFQPLTHNDVATVENKHEKGRASRD